MIRKGGQKHIKRGANYMWEEGPTTNRKGGQEHIKRRGQLHMGRRGSTTNKKEGHNTLKGDTNYAHVNGKEGSAAKYEGPATY